MEGGVPSTSAGAPGWAVGGKHACSPAQLGAGFPVKGCRPGGTTAYTLQEQLKSGFPVSYL